MRILVTGGAGSIGSATALRLASEGHDIRIMDINEETLWTVKTENPAIDCRLGDVQFDLDVIEAMDRVEAVIHCAAYKHVTFCERARQAAIRVNVKGTENVLEAANGLRVVLLSTDKAISGTSWMGRTKRQAEDVARSFPNANIVRFGNVVGSRGSLIPAVLRYASLGKPILMTDPEMTRFFMTMSEAVGGILVALEEEEGGKLIMPDKLRSAKLGLFLSVCRDRLAPGAEIKRIGPHPGEALHEQMEQGERFVSSDDPALLMDRGEIGRFLTEALRTTPLSV